MENNISLIGTKIKFLREKHNLTQKELAKKIDVKLNTIHRIETSQQTPKIETIIRLCNLFNVSSDFILSLDDNNLITSNEVYHECITQPHVNLDKLTNSDVAHIKNVANYLKSKNERKK